MDFIRSQWVPEPGVKSFWQFSVPHIFMLPVGSSQIRAAASDDQSLDERVTMAPPRRLLPPLKITSRRSDAVDEDALRRCSRFFSENYGRWSPCGARPGKQV